MIIIFSPTIRLGHIIDVAVFKENEHTNTGTNVVIGIQALITERKENNFFNIECEVKDYYLKNKILFKTFVGNRTYFFPTIYNGFFYFGHFFYMKNVISIHTKVLFCEKTLALVHLISRKKSPDFRNKCWCLGKHSFQFFNVA
jgi:hypothetical protein